MDESDNGPMGRGLDAVSGAARGLASSALGWATLALRLGSARPVAMLHDMRESLLDAQVPKMADAILARLDVESLIADHIDVQKLVETVLDRIDLTALARDRIDLAQLASEVIEEIDLPTIIRQSSSGVASEVVSGARATAATADEAVARFLTRRRKRHEP